MLKMCQTFVSNINNNQKVYRPKSSSASVSFYVKSDWLIRWMCVRACVHICMCSRFFIYYFSYILSLWASTIRVTNVLKIFHRMQQCSGSESDAFNNIHFSGIVLSKRAGEKESERDNGKRTALFFIYANIFPHFGMAFTVHIHVHFERFYKPLAYFQCITFINIRESLDAPIDQR